MSVKKYNSLNNLTPTQFAVHTKQIKSYTLCRDCSGVKILRLLFAYIFYVVN